MSKNIKPAENSTDIDSTIQASIENSFFIPRVLVVDDENRVRQACQRFLSEEGCEVEQADNGLSCLEMISENHYDIILLDIMMPGMSGLEVLKKVKSFHPDTVVIVITGYATLEYSINAMKKGAFDFLSKPFTPTDLRIVISKAIDFIRTLQDIATEKSRMRVMINSLCNGVLTTDNQKNVALANPAFVKMMGCRRNRVIGQPVSDLVTDTRILDMIDQVMDQSQDAHSQVTEEITIQNSKENDETIIGVRCMPFKDRLNRNLGAVTLLQDITALKKIDQLKSNFVSMVAHELKSPLNTILMQLNVVLDGLAGELTDKQREILTRNHDKIKSLTALTSELLDLSKIESGLINQEREEIDLAQMMVDQAEFYRDQALSKSIKISTDNDNGPAFFMGNKHNLEEVFSNLISNAIRYSPEGGKIRLSICIDQGSIIIRVADSGFGIEKEELKKIFKKFYRVKNEKTRQINGTGLGLSIVKSVVEAHHGSVKVESRTGKGTTFSIRLPAHRSDR